MKDITDDELDKLFQDAAHHFEPDADAENGWIFMEQKLDNQLNMPIVKRRLFFFSVLEIVLVMLIFLLSNLLLNNPKDEKFAGVQSVNKKETIQAVAKDSNGSTNSIQYSKNAGQESGNVPDRSKENDVDKRQDESEGKLSADKLSSVKSSGFDVEKSENELNKAQSTHTNVLNANNGSLDNGNDMKATKSKRTPLSAKSIDLLSKGEQAKKTKKDIGSKSSNVSVEQEGKEVAKLSKPKKESGKKAPLMAKSAEVLSKDEQSENSNKGNGSKGSTVSAEPEGKEVAKLNKPKTESGKKALLVAKPAGVSSKDEQAKNSKDDNGSKGSTVSAEPEDKQVAKLNKPKTVSGKNVPLIASPTGGSSKDEQAENSNKANGSKGSNLSAEQESKQAKLNKPKTESDKNVPLIAKPAGVSSKENQSTGFNSTRAIDSAGNANISDQYFGAELDTMNSGRNQRVEHGKVKSTRNKKTAVAIKDGALNNTSGATHVSSKEAQNNKATTITTDNSDILNKNAKNKNHKLDSNKISQKSAKVKDSGDVASQMFDFQNLDSFKKGNYTAVNSEKDNQGKKSGLTNKDYQASHPNLSADAKERSKNTNREVTGKYSKKAVVGNSGKEIHEDSNSVGNIEGFHLLKIKEPNLLTDSISLRSLVLHRVFIDDPSSYYKTNRPVKTINKGMRVNVMSSFDLSSVGFKTLDSPGWNLGITLEYTFKNRLTLISGVIYSQKRYSAGSEDYHATSGWYKGTLESINGACTVIDIPVNLRYDVFQKRKFNIFSSIGFSSYIMKKENYNYVYWYNNANEHSSWEVDNKNKHYFGVANFSVGYERKITSKLSLQIEPFIKVPLVGVGYNKLDLTSSGIFISVRYKLW